MQNNFRSLYFQIEILWTILRDLSDACLKFQGLRTTLLFMTLIAESHLALSADWIEIHKSKKISATYFIDQNSIGEDGTFAKAWVMQNERASKSLRKTRFRSVVSMYLVDCERKNTASVRGIYFSGYMGEGDVLSSFNKDIDTQTLKPVKPKSLGADVLNFVCTRAEQSRKLQT